MIVHRDASGPVAVGRLLGRGGEGQVFALAKQPGRAIKVYDAPDAAREAKVRSMIEADLAVSCTVAAFPRTVATTAAGDFVGFTMDLVTGGQPIHELYSPGSRRRTFPDANWRFLVRTATNVARSFARVHAAGAIVGDVNGSGILVSPRAVATLIDADSFQYGRDHPCRVGVPEFTPPELQQRSLDGIERTVDHDAFGLAVLVFHLLFLGRHPFAGVPEGRDIDLPDAIRQSAFAYSRVRRPRIHPPANTLLLTDLPLRVANLFERAFSGLVARPRPAEWVEALVSLEAGLLPCGRNRTHHRPSAEDCVWCRIDRGTGSPAFGPPVPVQDRPTVPLSPSASQVEASRVLARARTGSGEGLIPVDFGKPPSRGTGVSQQTTGSASSKDTAPPISPSTTDDGNAEKACRKAQRDLDTALDGWRTRVGAWHTARIATDVAAEIDRQRQAAMRHRRDAARSTKVLREKVVSRELAKRKVQPNIFPGIGERGVAKLANAGIVSAADLTPAALRGIPGIGERAVTLLLLWRDRVRIEIDRTTVVEDEEGRAALSRLDADRCREQVDEAGILDRMVSRLSSALDQLAVRAAQPDERVQAATAALDRILNGYRGGATRHAPATAPVATPSPPQSPTKARRRGTLCPKCAGPMVRRWAQRGSAPDTYFLGCAAYPACTGSRPLRRRTP